MKNIFFIVVVLIFLVIPASAGYNISGYIQNKHNESVYNASVFLNQTNAHSDINGYYNFSNVSSGNYTIKAIAFPYANKTITGIVISDSDIDNLNFTMNVPQAQPQDDTTPIFVIIIVLILILFVAV